MSLAENLLNTLSTNAKNEMELIPTDEEPHIIVDENRRIIVPEKLKNIAVKGDKNIETVTFDVVRFWDGHDFLEFGIYLNYVLPNKKEGTYVPEFVTVSPKNNNYITFDWTIDSTYTNSAGKLSISITARKTDDEGNLIKQWGSYPNDEMNIANGYSPSEVAEDEIEKDVVTQILQAAQSSLKASNIVNELGDGVDKVISQKAMTDIITSDTVVYYKEATEEDLLEGGSFRLIGHTGQDGNIYISVWIEGDSYFKQLFDYYGSATGSVIQDVSYDKPPEGCYIGSEILSGSISYTKKIEKRVGVDIVSHRGYSDSIVMSQKSVTEGFDSIEKDLDKTKKRVINLEKGISPDPFYTDDSVSYVKNVPSNALPYAEIEKVGGITRKSKNLLPAPYFDGDYKEGYGVTYRVNSDGSVTVSGTATNATFTFVFAKSLALLNGMFYTLSEGIILSYKDANGVTQYAQNTFVWSNAYTLLQVYFQVRPGETVSKTIYPMLLRGSYAITTYEPPFEGLRSAKVTEIETVGVNLALATSVYANTNKYRETTLDGRNVVAYCPNSTVKNKVCQFSENTQYTMSGWFKNVPTSSSNTSDQAAMTFFYTDGTSTSKPIDYGSDWKYITLTSSLGKTVVAVGTSAYNYTSDVYVDVDTFMLHKGTAALPYVTYTKHTLPIPQAVQDLNGYGESNPDNAEEYNYIDWDRLVFVAKGHIVDGLWISFDVVKETDISYYLTNDNFIKVEGSGVITMLNEYQFDVPSEITYMLKG